MRAILQELVNAIDGNTGFCKTCDERAQAETRYQMAYDAAKAELAKPDGIVAAQKGTVEEFGPDQSAL